MLLLPLPSTNTNTNNDDGDKKKVVAFPSFPFRLFPSRTWGNCTGWLLIDLLVLVGEIGAKGKHEKKGKRKMDA